MVPTEMWGSKFMPLPGRAHCVGGNPDGYLAVKGFAYVYKTVRIQSVGVFVVPPRTRGLNDANNIY